MKKLLLVLVLLFTFSCVTIGQDLKNKEYSEQSLNKENERAKEDIKQLKSEIKEREKIISYREELKKENENIIKYIEKQLSRKDIDPDLIQSGKEVVDREKKSNLRLDQDIKQLKSEIEIREKSISEKDNKINANDNILKFIKKQQKLDK
jgi:chromosome segregation ATPase